MAKPKFLPVPMEVLKEFCWFIRCQHPENDNWPSVRSEKTEQAWNDIAANFGWALDPYLPWMDEFEGESSLLRAALDSHNYGHRKKEFPIPAILNENAQQLWRAHCEALDIVKRKEELEKEKEVQKQGGSDVMWRCNRLLAHRGIMPLNPDNPYAERMDEILTWAQMKGLPTKPLPKKHFLRCG